MSGAACKKADALEAGHFYGHNVRSESRAGLILSETHYTPRLYTPPHSHQLPYFSLLVGGSYWEVYGRRIVTYTPGAIAFHPARETHHGGMGPQEVRAFHVEVGEPWIERAEDHGPLPVDTVDRRSGDLPWLGLRLFQEFRSRSTASALVIEGLLLEMLGSVIREGEGRPGSPAWIDATIGRLHDEFDHSLTVREIARDLDISPVRLSRAFRQSTGTTIGEYVRQLRVQYVSERLIGPDVRLAALAIEAGFSDQSHMTRTFKRVTGFTPAAYRRLVTD